MTTAPRPSLLILPPSKPYRRLGSWTLFERRFEPIPRDENRVLWDVGAVPPAVDPRHWWTVVDAGELILCAGFHFVNRFGYAQCHHRWDGEWQQHPEYAYE